MGAYNPRPWELAFRDYIIRALVFKGIDANGVAMDLAKAKKSITFDYSMAPRKGFDPWIVIAPIGQLPTGTDSRLSSTPDGDDFTLQLNTQWFGTIRINVISSKANEFADLFCDFYEQEEEAKINFDAGLSILQVLARIPLSEVDNEEYDRREIIDFECGFMYGTTRKQAAVNGVVATTNIE